MNNNSRIQINGFFFIYLSFILVVLFNDYIVYLTSIDDSWLSYSIAVLLFFLLFFVSFRNYTIKFPRLYFYDILAILFFSGILFLRFLVPDDDDFDTLNYHIYIQQNWTEDHLFFNFLPGRPYNTFSFPLGDRMFYVFRAILGYRLGVSLNLLVILLLYLQVKDLLFNFTSQNRRLKQWLLALLSTIILFNAALFTVFWSYWIDLLALPLFLEIIGLVFYQAPTNNKSSILYFCLLNGIVISFKVVYLTFVLLFGVMYILRNRHYFRPVWLLLGFGVLLAPIAIYAHNAYYQTGNPVFPWYNGVFKSPYFLEENWIDRRWGPFGIIEILIWPFYIWFVPERLYEFPVYPRMPLGYLVAIIWLGLLIIRPLKDHTQNRAILSFLGMTTIISLLWGKFMMGYIRYGGFLLEILYGIIICAAVLFLLDAEKNRKTAYLLSGALCVAGAALLYYSGYNVFATNREAGFRYPIYRQFDRHRNNARYVLIDRDLGIDPKMFDHVGLWLDLFDNPADPALISVDVPITSIYSVSNELTASMLDQMIDKHSNSGDLYAVVSTYFIADTFNTVLNQYGLEPDGNLLKVKPFYRDRWKSLYIIKLKNATGEMKNSFVQIKSEQEHIALDLPIDCKGKIHFTGLAGLHPVAEPWNSDGFILDFYLVHNGIKKPVHSVKIKQTAQFYEIFFDISPAEIQENAQLQISLSNSKRKNNSGDWAGIINPLLVCEE